jgi:hypothetical protein
VPGWDTSQARAWHAYQRHTTPPPSPWPSSPPPSPTNALAATPASPPPPATGPPSPAPPPNPAPAADTRAPEPAIALGHTPLPTHPDQPCPTDIGLIKLTANETRRPMSLLAGTTAEHLKTLGLAWSNWRRRHQAIASRRHWRAASAPSHKATRPKRRPHNVTATAPTPPQAKSHRRCASSETRTVVPRAPHHSRAKGGSAQRLTTSASVMSRTRVLFLCKP